MPNKEKVPLGETRKIVGPEYLTPSDDLALVRMISPQVSEINGTFKGHSPFGDDQGRGLIANQGKIMRLIGSQMTDDNVVLAAGHPHRTFAVNPLRQRPPEDLDTHWRG